MTRPRVAPDSNDVPASEPTESKNRSRSGRRMIDWLAEATARHPSPDQGGGSGRRGQRPPLVRRSPNLRRS